MAFYSTGLGDHHTHDAQIGFLVCGYTPDIWRTVFRMPPEEIFDDPAAVLDPDKGLVVMLPNPVQPHSEGSVRLASADPAAKPVIDLNYFADPHDVAVMVAVMRRCLEIAQGLAGRGDRGVDGAAQARRVARVRHRRTNPPTPCSRTSPGTTRSPSTTPPRRAASVTSWTRRCGWPVSPGCGWPTRA